MSRTNGIRVARFRNGAFLAGLLALILCGILAVFDARQFFASYLFSWLLWLGLAMGCLILTMIHHLTGGRWGYAIRRFLEAGLATVPLMTILFVPIIFGLQELYPWATHQGGAAREVVMKRGEYMTP